jgi:hypothetical protein
LLEIWYFQGNRSFALWVITTLSTIGTILGEYEQFKAPSIGGLGAGIVATNS